MRVRNYFQRDSGRGQIEFHFSSVVTQRTLNHSFGFLRAAPNRSRIRIDPETRSSITRLAEYFHSWLEELTQEQAFSSIRCRDLRRPMWRESSRSRVDARLTVEAGSISQ